MPRCTAYIPPLPPQCPVGVRKFTEFLHNNTLPFQNLFGLSYHRFAHFASSFCLSCTAKCNLCKRDRAQSPISIFETNFKLFQLANNLTNGLRQNIEALFQRIHRHLQLRMIFTTESRRPTSLHDEAVFKRLVNDRPSQHRPSNAPKSTPHSKPDATCRDAGCQSSQYSSFEELLHERRTPHEPRLPRARSA